MRTIFVLLTAALVALTACGPGNGDSTAETPKPPSSNNPEGALTEWQVVNGLGPVTEKIQLGPVNAKMATEGEQIFEGKCSPCHKLDERYVGPPLGDVTQRRTPEFIMNMILDPSSMVKYHPEIKKLLAQYYTPMTFQNVTREDARKILEYLRQQGDLRPVN